MERDREDVLKKRDEFLTWQRSVRPRRIFCVDETGSFLHLSPRYARSLRGQPALGRQPRNRGRVLTILGALTEGRVVGLMVVEGGTSSAVFCYWLQHFLLPEMRAGDILVMDNLAAHRSSMVRALLDEHGIEVRYTPPYHPEFNPIELAWKHIKQRLRRAQARTRVAWETALVAAARSIHPEHIENWFAHCGFRVAWGPLG